MQRRDVDRSPATGRGDRGGEDSREAEKARWRLRFGVIVFMSGVSVFGAFSDGLREGFGAWHTHSGRMGGELPNWMWLAIGLAGLGWGLYGLYRLRRDD